MLKKLMLWVPALAVGCSAPLAVDGTEFENPRDTVVLQPETVLLDGAPGVQSLEVGADRIVVVTDGTALPVTVGSVLVGRHGGGYLREVTEVVDQGVRQVYRTRQADLSQAVVDGRALAQIHLADELRSATTWDLGGRILVDETLWSDAAGNYVDVTAFVAEGSHVTLDPVFDFDLELFSGSWVDARFESTVTLDYEADFVANVSGSFSERVEGHLYTREIPFAFEMGPVPVVGVATVAIHAGFEGDFEGAGSAMLHTEAHAWGALGAGYDGQWHGSADGGIGGDLGLTDSSWSQDIHTRAWIRADLGVELYGSAGAELTLQPWVEASSCGQVGLDVDGGLEGSHAYHFGAFGWDLYEWGPYAFETERYDLFELECTP